MPIMAKALLKLFLAKLDLLIWSCDKDDKLSGCVHGCCASRHLVRFGTHQCCFFFPPIWECFLWTSYFFSKFLL